VEKWLMMTFVLENCLLDLFVVLDLNLASNLIDKFFFLSLKSWKYILFILFVFDNSMKNKEQTQDHIGKQCSKTRRQETYIIKNVK
jgi:hypothetical protein